MTDIKAADLPEGSVVADTETAAIRTSDVWQDAAWRATSGARLYNSQVDEMLNAGAVVLREGRG